MHLFQVFRVYGKIVDVKVMHGRSSRTGQSCAFVVYSSTTEADKCLDEMKAHEYTPGDGNMVVKSADRKGSGKGTSKGKKGKGKSKGKKGKGKGGKGNVGKNKEAPRSWQWSNLSYSE